MRALQAFGRSVRKLLACFAGALGILVLLDWSRSTAWSEAESPLLLWFVLGSAMLTVVHSLVSRRLRQSSAIRQLTALCAEREQTCSALRLKVSAGRRMP